MGRQNKGSKRNDRVMANKRKKPVAANKRKKPVAANKRKKPVTANKSVKRRKSSNLRTGKKSKQHKEPVTLDLTEISDSEQKQDSYFSFDGLPDLVVEKIFTYLNLADLCRARRVCKKWNLLSERKSFWTRVDTQHLQLTSSEVQKFVQFLPPIVTHLRISNTVCSLAALYLPELCQTLRENLPHLQVLIFENFVLKCLTQRDNSDFYALEDLPQDLHVLSFRNSYFIAEDIISTLTDSSLSKIKVLDISFKYTSGRHPIFLASRLPDLEELRLTGLLLNVEDIVLLSDINQKLKVLQLHHISIHKEHFSAILQFSESLTKLYLCDASMGDEDLDFEGDNIFPHLEEICLRRTRVTQQGVERVLNEGRSLKCVYTSLQKVSGRTITKRMLEKVHYSDNDKVCNEHREMDFFFHQEKTKL